MTQSILLIFSIIYVYLSLEMPILLKIGVEKEARFTNMEGCSRSLKEYFESTQKNCPPPEIDYYAEHKSYLNAPKALCMLLPLNSGSQIEYKGNTLRCN